MMPIRHENTRPEASCVTRPTLIVVSPLQRVSTALNLLSQYAARLDFTRTDHVSQQRCKDALKRYALSLIRLRECAQAAQLKRLTRACDAMAITLSHILDQPVNRIGWRDCHALSLFVTHARTMLGFRA